jgi:hypothetical protein
MIPLPLRRINRRYDAIQAARDEIEGGPRPDEAVESVISEHHQSGRIALTTTDYSSTGTILIHAPMSYAEVRRWVCYRGFEENVLGFSTTARPEDSLCPPILRSRSETAKTLQTQKEVDRQDRAPDVDVY